MASILNFRPRSVVMAEVSDRGAGIADEHAEVASNARATCRKGEPAEERNGSPDEPPDPPEAKGWMAAPMSA